MNAGADQSTLVSIGRTLAVTIPFLSGIIFLLVGAVPVGIPGLSAVSPLLALGVIFFWAATRPLLLPPVAVFALGIMQDALSGGPIGLWALVFLFAHFFIVSQRRVLIGMSFGLGWISFAPVVLGVACLAWAAASVYYESLVSVMPFLVQGMFTLLAYPVVAWISIFIWRRLPAES